MPHLKNALGHCTTGMDHALWDALTVELCDLLDQVVVLQEDGAAGTHCIATITVCVNKTSAACAIILKLHYHTVLKTV